MRIFKIKNFHVWSQQISLDDKALVKTANEMVAGLYDANLGGNVYKKRVAVGNRGKRDGARVILAFKAGQRTIFIYGFAKNKRANVTNSEEEALKALAKIYFSCSDEQINHAVKTGELIEVKYE